MLYYFKDDKGVLRCAAGELDISDQVRARHAIEIDVYEKGRSGERYSGSAFESRAQKLAIRIGKRSDMYGD